jgi:hypothetical protein
MAVADASRGNQPKNSVALLRRGIVALANTVVSLI